MGIAIESIVSTSGAAYSISYVRRYIWILIIYIYICNYCTMISTHAWRGAPRAPASHPPVHSDHYHPSAAVPCRPRMRVTARSETTYPLRRRQDPSAQANCCAGRIGRRGANRYHDGMPCLPRCATSSFTITAAARLG